MGSAEAASGPTNFVRLADSARRDLWAGRLDGVRADLGALPEIRPCVLSGNRHGRGALVYGHDDFGAVSLVSGPTAGAGTSVIAGIASTRHRRVARLHRELAIPRQLPAGVELGEQPGDRRVALDRPAQPATRPRSPTAAGERCHDGLIKRDKSASPSFDSATRALRIPTTSRRRATSPGDRRGLAGRAR